MNALEGTEIITQERAIVLDPGVAMEGYAHGVQLPGEAGFRVPA